MMSNKPDLNLLGENGSFKIMDRENDFFHHCDGTESCKSLDIESNDDTDYEDYDENSIFTGSIVVGYAFGPKKMNTMGVVMAEASKTKLCTYSATAGEVGVEHSLLEVVLPSFISQNDPTQISLSRDDRCMVPINLNKNDDTTNEKENSEEMNVYPPSPMAKRNPRVVKKKLQEQESIVFSIDGHVMKSTDETKQNDLRNIVRYFRSSCSSVGSNDASVTTGTCTATSVASSSQFTGTTLDRSLSCHGRSHTFQNSSASQTSSKFAPIRISFVPLDPDFPLEEQHGGKLDVILHKLTEDILCLSQLAMADSKLKNNLKENRVHEADYVDVKLCEEDKQALHRVLRVSSYHKLNPQCCLVDDPARVMTLMSRADIADTLRNCLQGISSKSGMPVGSPAYAVILQQFRMTESKSNCASNGCNDSAIDSQWLHRKIDSLSYPIIVKPLTAAGTKASHAMAVVLHPSSLYKVVSQKAPCLLQEYTNHDAALYKVYVLGEHVSVHKRRSLPNLPIHASIQCQYDYVEFDSQRPYPRLCDFGYPETDLSIPPDHRVMMAKMPLDWDKSIVTVDEIMPIVTALKTAFGLQLFGFDVIITRDDTESDSGGSVCNDSVPHQMERNPNRRLLVIDVNYFPSYKEVTNFPSLLAKYLTDRVLQSRKK